MMKPIVTTFLYLGAIVFGGFPMRHGLTYAQCLDSEALLKVSYDLPSWKYRDVVKVLLTSSSPQVGKTDVEEMTTNYPSNETFSFETCIPRNDTCGHIAVVGPPKDLYEISWDGEVLVETGPQLPAIESNYDDLDGFMTTTQFGNGCIPECDEREDEALFEFQYWTSRWRLYERNMSQKGYFLADQYGNKIYAEYASKPDSTAQTLAGLYAKRMCLPKNDCYRLIMGDYSKEDIERVAISFNGKTIYKHRPIFFESIDFGDGCPGVRSCDPDKESKVQFFMKTEDDSRRRALSWEVTSHDASFESQLIHRGKQPAESNVTLHYEEICVPKQSCVTFSLMEEENDDKKLFAYADYMLKMDGVIYRKTLYFPYSSSRQSEGTTTHLGDCVKAIPPICNSVNETLLELNFQTIHRPISSRLDFPSSWDTYWAVFKTRELENEQNDSLFFSPEVLFSTFDLLTSDYEYDSAYRVINCIPSIEPCLYKLFVETYGGRSPFEFYSIKMNGTLSTSDITVGTNLYGGEYEVTELDSSCDVSDVSSDSSDESSDESDSSSTSSGAIVGITIASVIVTGVSIASCVL